VHHSVSVPLIPPSPKVLLWNSGGRKLPILQGKWPLKCGGVGAGGNSTGSYQWCNHLANASEVALTTASMPFWSLLVAVWPF